MIHLAGHLLAPDDRGPSIVSVDRGRIAAIDPVEPDDLAAAAAAAGAIGDASSRIVPGLVDIQVNGAFGQDFGDPSADLAAAAARLPELGVTAFCPTIVSAAAERYGPALDNLSAAARRPRSRGARQLGVHVEGPYINPRRAGTHEPAALRAPDQDEAVSWLDRATVAWFTLAPELPGAIELIERLVHRGVRVSIGHSDATWDEAAAAARAGATMATHLFNAMRPLHHRDPGIAGFALASDLTVGVIGDGHHLAFETLRLVARVKAPDELVLVTDALAGLGLPPGRYTLGEREYISDGTCGRLPDGTLSGSLLPLSLALRNLVEQVGLAPEVAVRLATLNPARALGLDAHLGRIDVGRAADLVVLDPDWRVRATLIDGVVAYRRTGAG